MDFDLIAVMTNLPAYRNFSLEDIEGEIWKDIAPKGLYQISNFGRVKSLSRVCLVKGGGSKMRPTQIRKQLKPTECSLMLGRKQFRIARLVATYFIRPLKAKELVIHRDNNYRNNKLSNLLIVKDQAEMRFYKNLVIKLKLK